MTILQTTLITLVGVLGWWCGELIESLSPPHTIEVTLPSIEVTLPSIDLTSIELPSEELTQEELTQEELTQEELIELLTSSGDLEG
jgi:hypothetical protein